MIIGTPMDQEDCLNDGQALLNFFIGRKNSKRIYVVREEINEKTVDIQDRSSMARTLGQNGKECQAEGEATVVT